VTSEAERLEQAVRAASADLAARDLPQPDALFLLGTGVGLLPGALKASTRVPLERVAGVPEAWHGQMLFAGDLAGASVWMLEDAPGRAEEGSESPSTRAARWTRAFPCWLAASAGAGVLVHTSAGVALAEPGREPAAPPGTLGLVRDHLNVSGHTPLTGLGDSTLGPLFPDTTALHHAALRARALAIAAEHGLAAAEVVCACTLGPSLETPAERLWLARAGADVAVQNLADPLLAAAHAGLAVLAIACVTDSGRGGADIASMVDQAYRLAPALEELCSSLGPDLAAAAEEQFVEE
jgi:purine-nucleoside phosphorylase